VLIDASQAIENARAEAQGVWRRFWISFVWGVVSALVAMLCVVGMVWQAERLAHQRSQFAASAAHELRTPLAGMRMYSEMLAEGLGDPTRAKEYARRVADEAERLGRVVGNVLEFTRLERGTLKVRPELGDLAATVRDGVARQLPALEAMGARVEMMIADELPQACFDRDAVGEILQNLLDNAEKHTRAATNRTIHVSLATAANGVALSVADHGPGVPSEIRQRLFRPFERGTHEDAPAGLGLGLVLVQALALAQGGNVSYADAHGGGAIFTVTFPA
jgi:signal transduction histidine kinase